MLGNSTLDETYISLIKNKELYGASLYNSAAIIVKACAQALKLDRVSIWLMNTEQSSLDCVVLYRAADDEYENDMQIDANSFPRYFKALLNHRVVDACSAETDDRTSELLDVYLKPLNVKSLLDATLRYEGKVQGVLCAEALVSERQWSHVEQMFIASVADLFSQRIIQNQLAISERKYKSIYENTKEGIVLFEQGSFSEVNPAMCDMFRGKAAELVGKTPLDISPKYQADGEASSAKAEGYISACMQGEVQCFKWIHQRLDGELFDVEITMLPINFLGNQTLFASIRDISESVAAERLVKSALEKLEHRVSHDSLTGLRNREQLHEYVNGLITQSVFKGAKLEIAMMLFDLNRFKEINDTLGHATGDKVLIKLAKVLKLKVEDMGGSIFRLGGDEFVVVFNNQSSQAPFSSLAERLSEHIKTAIVVDDISVEMDASFGIALYPENGKDSHELLRCADVAMYHTKSNEGASSFYDAKNDYNDKRRLTMMVELGQAIREDQLLLHFQPRIDLQTSKVTGCEALVRWEHPIHGLVPPGDFLPLAEMSDLIHPLSAKVLSLAIDEIKRLLDKGYYMPIAVNLSARNLSDANLTKTIESLLSKAQIDAKLLEIEITESALINHPQRALDNLNYLAGLGISIAIDDFGTGYSSLSYLTKLPLDTLKIDRSFVNQMFESESDSVIVSSTISLAHSLGLKVVAEGVEDQKSLDVLASKSCDQAQGFYIARPKPVADFEKWLDAYDNKFKLVANSK